MTALACAFENYAHQQRYYSSAASGQSRPACHTHDVAAVQQCGRTCSSACVESSSMLRALHMLSIGSICEEHSYYEHDLQSHTLPVIHHHTWNVTKCARTCSSAWVESRSMLPRSVLSAPKLRPLLPSCTCAHSSTHDIALGTSAKMRYFHSHTS